MWDTVADHIKTIGIALGVSSAIAGTYTTLGGPIPASVQLVDSRVAQINGSIKSLTEIVLEGQLEEHELARSAMRAEKTALEQSIKVSPATTQATIQARVGTLEDKLKELEGRDMQLRTKIQVLREGKA